MGEKVKPVVHLEITVPHIVFPTENSQQQKAGEANTSEQDDDQEQVRILTPGPQEQHSSRQGTRTSAEITGEATTYTSAAGPFRLFRLKDVPVQGQALWLQVLRRVAGTSGPFSLAAEQAFSIEFRHHTHQDHPVEQAMISSPSSLVPGLNQIVIFLNEEGAPGSFRIDSAEG
jgi:hypothetical protein